MILQLNKEEREDWLQSAEEFWLASKGMSTNTISAYLFDVGAFLGQKTLILTRDGIEKWLAELSKCGKSPKTVSRNLSSLKSFFNHAVNMGWVKENPTINVARPKIGKSLPKALTGADMRKLLNTAEGDKPEQIRLKLILQLIYATGIRVSELTSLTLADITAAETENNEQFLRVTGKGSKTRLVPLGPIASQTLGAYITQTRPLFAKTTYSDALFPGTRVGQGLTRQRIFQIIQKAGESVGVKVAPHHLRHTFATHLLENDADLRAVQLMLGHASLNTTQIYTKVASNTLKGALESFHPLSTATKFNS